MENLWLILGIVVLAATLLDVFLTALNFDEAGFIAGPLSRAQWRVLRRFTRRLSRRWRPVALRQVTGLQVVVIITAWLFGVIFGFGLIYRGLMSRSAFSVSGTDAGLTLFDALYFSAAQMATVGGSSLTAETDLLRFLSIAESFSGVILVSLILTFLLGVYSVISDLNALCRHFFTAERGAGSAPASLAPFFHDGESNGLDGHLDGITDSFSSYVDGLRLHHAAYYFQSGRDQFALPYAVRMLAGTISALRWGLPSGHPAASEPGLVPLTFQFLEFGDYLERTMAWKNLPVPEVVSAEEFSRIVGDLRGDDQDVWAARFVQLDAAMARLAGTDPLADLDDAYRRYSEWLPFAYRAERITLAVSDDLDYQPVIVSARPVSFLHAEDALALRIEEGLRSPALVAQDDRPRISRLGEFLRRHLAQTDPGYARLRAAARAIIAAVAAAALLYVVFEVVERTAIEPAVFGGFVAMLSSSAAVGPTPRDRRITSIVVMAPIAAVVLLGALASESSWLTDVLLVVVATVAVWARRYGPRGMALGMSSFMVYYFALLLRLQLADAVDYLVAAAVGVALAFLVNHVLIPERPPAVLRSGLGGFSRRLGSFMDALFDAVSWARWDHTIRRHIEFELQQVRAHAAFVGGQLTGEENVTGVPAERATVLRLRLFDTELAAMSLVMAARALAGVTVSLEARARLAGRIELLQAHLAEMTVLPPPGAAHSASARPRLAPWADEEAPAVWPRAARVLYQSVDELHRVAQKLRTAAIAALDPSVPFDAPLSAEEQEDEREAVADATGVPVASDASAGGVAPGRRLAVPQTRRAVQAGVATAVSLGAGWLVSATHQYWATLAAFQVLGDTDGDTFLKAARRVGGTVAGAIVGFAVALSDVGITAVILPLLAVAVFASTYYRQVAPAVSTFWTTTMFALLYDYLGGLTTLALEQRVLETLLGALIALCVAVWVLPNHTRTVLGKDVAVLARDVDAIVTASMGRLAGDPTTARPALRQRLLAVNQHARKIGATAEPMRRAPGALSPGGIEGRLTAVWSLSNHTRHLVRAAERAIAAGVEPDARDWRGLGRATSRNVTALVTALDGELPGGVVPEVAEFERDGASPTARAVDDVLHELARVNQTLLALLEAVSPGAVNEAHPAPAEGRGD